MRDVVWFPGHPEQLHLCQERYRLIRPYGYEWRTSGERHRWILPVGWEHDGASVPDLARPFVPRRTLERAAPHHDRAYHCQGMLPVGEHVRWDRTRREWRDALTGAFAADRTPWSRRDADRLFARMAREDPLGPSIWQRRMAYRAVRVAGVWAWHRRKGGGR